MRYLFTLGHQPHLSTAELQAVFSRSNLKFEVIKTTNTLLLIDLSEKIDAEELINTLGGTVKIAEEISEKNITDYLLSKQAEGKIHFSLNGSENKQLALEIKKELKVQGCSVRYIEPKNTATILHNNLVKRKTDLTIFEDKIFVTVAIQPFEEFSERDYGRPGTDDRSGMLPPKLARMMINLGIKNKKDILLDPFCGSGTILTEALSIGLTNLLGSDIAAKAVSDTQKNIEWVKQEFHLSHINYQIYSNNVLNLGNKIKNDSIDTIVTEPYLGKPLKGREAREDLVNQARELADLYLGAFHSYYKILKKGGTVVMVFPKFQFQNEWIRVEILEKIKKTGFEHILFGDQNCLTYHRPNQHLAREIWRFKKN